MNGAGAEHSPILHLPCERHCAAGPWSSHQPWPGFLSLLYRGGAWGSGRFSMLAGGNLEDRIIWLHISCAVQDNRVSPLVCMCWWTSLKQSSLLTFASLSARAGQFGQVHCPLGLLILWSPMCAVMGLSVRLLRWAAPAHLWAGSPSTLSGRCRRVNSSLFPLGLFSIPSLCLLETDGTLWCKRALCKS